MRDDVREQVRALDQARKARRAVLQSDLSQAREDLHPRTIAVRWAERQYGSLATKAAHIARAARKSAPIAGVAAGALLLFSARKPISDFIRRIREERNTSKDDMA